MKNATVTIPLDDFRDLENYGKKLLESLLRIELDLKEVYGQDVTPNSLHEIAENQRDLRNRINVQRAFRDGRI